MRGCAPRRAAVLAAIFLAPAGAWSLGGAPAGEEKLRFGRFGDVVAYRGSPEPATVVLFVSGDAGWDREAADMARGLAESGVLVVGADIKRYRKELAKVREKCAYPAADFEGLSQYVQQALGFTDYHPPILAGYASGAALVYAALSQAPPGTFRAAMSIGFCPYMLLDKPLCPGHALRSAVESKGRGATLLPAAGLDAPWVVFPGPAGQVCASAAVPAFVAAVPNARIVSLPGGDRGFSAQKDWQPQFKQELARLASAGSASRPELSLADIPIVEVPASSPRGVLAVIYSGDGGWAGIDKSLAARLSQEGVSVVGVDSLRYFWRRKTPESCAADLERILAHYSGRWQAREIVLVGYSFGADVLAPIVNRMGADWRARIRLVALLAPGARADFEFHLADWMRTASGPAAVPVVPEVERLAVPDVLCVHGLAERDEVCTVARSPVLRELGLKGGHHFGGDVGAISRALRLPSGPP